MTFKAVDDKQATYELQVVPKLNGRLKGASTPESQTRLTKFI